jgi:hypothetical protein
MDIYNNVNIKDLNKIEEITDNNFLIVENEQGTNILDFKNFVVGPNNVSFYSNVVNLSSNINSLSSQSITDRTDLTTRINSVSTQSSTDLVTTSANILNRTPNLTLNNASVYNIYCVKSFVSTYTNSTITLQKPSNAVITQSDINLMMTSLPANTGMNFYISSLTNGGAGNTSYSFTITCNLNLATPVTVYYTVLTPY